MTELGSGSVGGFSADLRRRRQSAMLTQESLAELAGVDARTIRDIETGRTRRPRASTVRMLLAAMPERGESRPPNGALVPRELPPNTSGFVGRDAELAQLDRLADPSQTTVAVVTGMPGVGKTGLVVRWAHRAADAFPDGQLYVNLRGYDPGPPVDPGDVLGGFLRSLGLDGPDIPSSLDGRANRYRSLLAKRRLLVLLDNARCADQVRCLLPGAGSSVALVTSRDSLGGLSVRHGADRIVLDRLPPVEARELLRLHVGERVVDDPDAADTLIEQCVRLPLALRIAAQLTNARPVITLADLATELAGEEERLDLLDAGDEYSAVESVFSWSYRQLAEPEAELFRLLGAIPCREIDIDAAAALLGTERRHARAWLRSLVQAHLVQETAVGRYGMHDLLCAYANRLAAKSSAQCFDNAVSRLLEYYSRVAALAMDLLVPFERNRRPPLEPVLHATPALSDPGSALSWLEANCANIVALACDSTKRGRPDPAARLSLILYRYLDDRARDREAEDLHTAAIETADPELSLRAQANYGVVLWRSGRYLEAKHHYADTLSSLQAAGDAHFVAGVTGNLGVTCWRLGHDEEARQHFLRSAAMFRELGEPSFEARSLDNLSRLYQRMGRVREAFDTVERALRLITGVGDWPEGAMILSNYANVCRLLDRPTEAIEHHRRALETFRSARRRRDETEALNDLGMALCDAGFLDSAITHHQQALRHACDISDQFEQARAHEGIARIHERQGVRDLAHAHLSHALEIHTALNTPQAREIAQALREHAHDYPVRTVSAPRPGRST